MSQRVSQVRDVFNKDWDSGGLFFFRALKGEQSLPVDAVDRMEVIWLKVLKATKKSSAKFRLQDDDLHLVRVGQS